MPNEAPPIASSGFVPARSTADRGWAARLAPFGCFAVLLCAVVLLQWAGGAFSGAFQADAAAHYVTGLAIHDWLRAPTANPIRFVIDYHAHLPATAFGLWPPLFHAVEAVWMFAAGTGKTGVLLLSGLVAAATGSAVAIAAAPRAGWPAAGLAGLILATNPLVQRGSAELMLDTPCALAGFLAALAYAAYLARGRWGAALGFGVFAVAAMLVKYNAFALALVPPLCVLIARRWDLLLRASFYAPAVIVAVLVGPIYLKTAGLSQQGFQFSWGWTYLSLAAPFNALSVLEGLTPLVAPLALAGLVRAVAQGHRRDLVSPLEVACAALALAVFAFLLAVPVALQDRYLIPCLPPLFVLAACEAARWARRLAGPAPRAMGFALVAAAALVVSLPPQAAPQNQLAAAVRAARDALPVANPVVLLAGDGRTEQAMVAELAMAEAVRPHAWGIRGSRLLGGGGYNNADYQPRFADPADILAELDRYGVAVLLLHRSTLPNAWAHLAQLATLVDTMPERFRRVPGAPELPLLEVYVLPGHAGRQPDAAALTELSGPRALMRMVQQGPR